MTDEAEVFIRVEGGVGRLTLNRPAALHALTIGMVHEMTNALLAWQDDPAIKLVMLDHSTGRGFCAGGDVRYLYDSMKAGDGKAIGFFHDEYQLDHLLYAYAKPTVVFMDGLVMGGGSGIAMPCRYRIASEKTVFAMPETGIGLFPDVGASRFLPPLPEFGTTSSDSGIFQMSRTHLKNTAGPDAQVFLNGSRRDGGKIYSVSLTDGVTKSRSKRPSRWPVEFLR